MVYDHPLTEKEFNNPMFLNKNIEETITINGLLLTAENIWKLDTENRKQLLSDIIDHYHKVGFPYDDLSEDYIRNQFGKLVAKNPNEVLNKDGLIKNSASSCLDVTRYFCKDTFYKTKMDKRNSLEEVFFDRKLLEHSLKSRLGWCSTTEEGPEQPFIFNITDKMILQGIKSSGVGMMASQFKPLVAKYILSRYCKNSVLDYSCGWGARSIAAASLGLNYYGIDPATAKYNNNLLSFLKAPGFAVEGYSEDENAYLDFPSPEDEKGIDCAFSCTPYFSQERYGAKEGFVEIDNDYNAWLQNYWHKTVVNCNKKLRVGGYFILVMIELWNELPLLADMENAFVDEGLRFENKIYYVTSNNHLSGKRKSGKTQKSTECVLVYKKV
jgi:hypothetical protein